MQLHSFLLLLLLSFSADAGTVSFTFNPAHRDLDGTTEEIAEQLKFRREGLCSLDPKDLDEDELTASILEVFGLHYQEIQPMNHRQKYRILCKKSLEISESSQAVDNATSVASASLHKFYNVVKKYTSDVNEFRLQLCKIWMSLPTTKTKAPSYDPCHEHDEVPAVKGPDGKPEEILDELLGDILEAGNDREAASYVMGKIIEITRSPIPGRETEMGDATEVVFEKTKTIHEKLEEFLVMDDVPNFTTFRKLEEDFEGIADESRNSEIIKLESDIEGLEIPTRLRYKKDLVPCRKKFSYGGCGKRQQNKRVKRIVSGSDALPGHWPWTVVVNVSPLGFKDKICGGTLISDRFVVTAGHCIISAMINGKRTLDFFSVKVGVLRWQDPVEVLKLKAFYAAPMYDSDSFAEDIALLELMKPVTFNETVQPICLPFDFEDFIGQQASVTGWGYNRTGDSGSPGAPEYTEVLQETEVQVLAQQKCRGVLVLPQDSLQKRKAALCAGYEDGHTDSCFGDSGGPLMVETECGRWVLIGVVSYGQNCGTVSSPGIYASVSYFRNWINQITKLEDHEEAYYLRQEEESVDWVPELEENLSDSSTISLRPPNDTGESPTQGET